MALKIIDKKIVGTIDNLEAKLEGKIPVDRLELLYLVNSWGREKTFSIYNDDDNNEIIKIEQCEATQSEQALLVRKECYDLSKLDVSQITNMNGIFSFSEFKDDIGNWNVSNVTSMDNMFYNAEKFNSPLNNWDTSNVTNMNGMFYFAMNFNQPLDIWEVSNVTDMGGMFGYARNFNQALDNWDVSNVTSMRYMFFYAINFNQDLNSWNTNKTTNMSSVFCNALNFNGNISNWDISNVTNISSIFFEAKAFLNKYNNGELLPNRIDEIKKWFDLNRERMNEIDIKVKHGEDIDNFFSNINLKKNIIF